MKPKRILIASDIHLAHIDWYGVKTDERVAKFISDVEAEYKKEPFDALLLLGDYALDFWQWSIKGCYLREGISNANRFAKDFLARLGKYPFEIRAIAGNHEQYGEENFKRLVGHSRTGLYDAGEVLFVLLDNFAANLDPDFHSDGTFTGTDVTRVKKLLADYPDKKLVLCAHHFDPANESEAFRELLKNEPRLLCLFGGHVHLSRVVDLGEDCGNKKLIYTGNYSYSKEKDPATSFWGFREVYLDENGLTTRYITPENVYVSPVTNETTVHAYGKQDEVTIPF